MRSILFRPKEWIFTRAWDSAGCGLGMSGLRNRDEMEPGSILDV